MICRTFKIFRDSPASLFGRPASWRRGRLQRPHSGAILVLLALFIPIILGGIKYTQYRFSKKVPPLESIPKNELYKECAQEAALAVAQKWNPARTLANQENNPLQIARNVYDSHPCFQKTALGASVPGLSESGVSLAPSMLKSTDPNSSRTLRVKVEVEDDKIKVTTDNDVAHAVPAQCNLDVVLAIPVNSGVSLAALSQITDACKTFVSDHFYYTRGVYASIVPYSGKLSIPSSRSTWAVVFPLYSGTGNTVKLSDLYATNRGNGELLAQNYPWSGTVRPIMHRKNNNLFSNDNPNVDSRRYLRMNLNSCYASPQSSKCEHSCRGYSANTSCIVEPMTDMKSFCDDKLSGLRINSGDSYNKSNFVFMALEWANNMFQSWTAGSTAVGASSNNLSYPPKGKKKAIILIVNKAENFEPAELTYLGFKNDASEVLRESDVIKDFTSANRTYADGTSGTTIQGAKKLLSFSGSGSGNCTFTMSAPHTLKFVVEKAPTSSSGSIKFTNIKYKDVTYYQNNTTYAVNGRTSFIIFTDQLAADNTVKFVASGVKFISAEMTDKTVSSTEVTPVYYRLDGTRSGTGTAIITCNAKRDMTLTVVPKKTYAKIGDRPAITGFNTERQYEFNPQTTNLKYEAENADVSAVATIETTDTTAERVEKTKTIIDEDFPRYVYFPFSAVNAWFFPPCCKYTYAREHLTGCTIRDNIAVPKNCTSLTVVVSVFLVHSLSPVMGIREGNIRYNGETIAHIKEVYFQTTSSYNGYISIKDDQNHECELPTLSSDSGYDFPVIVLSTSTNCPSYIQSTLNCRNGMNYVGKSYWYTFKYNKEVPDSKTFEIYLMYCNTTPTGKFESENIQNGALDGSLYFHITCTCNYYEMVPKNEKVTTTSAATVANGVIAAQANQTKLKVIVTPHALSPSISRKKSNVSVKEDITNSKTITIKPSEYDYVESNGEYKITLDLKDIESISGLDMTDKLGLFNASISTPPAVFANNNAVIGTATLQSKTESACTSLKNAGVRIYTIGYGTTPSGYLSTCATASGGKSYTIRSSETDPQARLKEKLAEIAMELKAMGGYEAARVVR